MTYSQNASEPSTPIIGREQEVDVIIQLIAEESCRLVSVVGPGGVGKTAVARQAVRKLEELHKFNCLWLDLTPIKDVAGLRVAIAKVLGLDDFDLSSLSAHLRGRRTLVILDTLEHLWGSGELITQILATRSDVMFLATTRRRIGVQGERLVTINPLEVSTENSVEKALACASVKVFMHYAQTASPTFQLDAAGLVQVTALIRQTAGLPLAIQHIASRLGTFPPAQLILWMEQNPTLAWPTHAGSERQRSLEASLQWSIDLLSPPAKELFIQLAVFTEGWELRHAQAIAGLPDVERILLELTENHLIYATTLEGKIRYKMHKTSRGVVSKQLKASRQYQETLHKAAVFWTAEYKRFATATPEEIKALGRDWENIAEVMEALLMSDAANQGTAVELLLAAQSYGYACLEIARLMQWFGQAKALEVSEYQDQIALGWARVTVHMGQAAYGNWLAKRQLGRVQDLQSGQVGWAFCLAESEWYLGNKDEALKWLRQIAKTGILFEEVLLHINILISQQEYAPAEKLIAKSLDETQAKSVPQTQRLLVYLGVCQLGNKQVSSAISLLSSSLPQLESLGLYYDLVRGLCRLADLDISPMLKAKLLGLAKGQLEKNTLPSASLQVAIDQALGKLEPQERPLGYTEVLAELVQAQTIIAPSQGRKNPLSTREREVLRLVAEGHTNKEVAKQLDISPNTVVYYLNAAFKKLECRSRTEAVTIAMQNGWLEPTTDSFEPLRKA
jgi:predicted ATPase/DNA-binding CsgD family transcriptional regulator